MIYPAFLRGYHKSSIDALYGMIVAQARSPGFYRDLGVPDTVAGRFDMIVLHLVLVLQRLDGDRDGAVAQPLFDAFCRDLDDNLREMGVGDQAVPKRMRRFGEEFYGRQKAYRAALADPDSHALARALARNILGQTEIDDKAEGLSRYARAALAELDAASNDAVLNARCAFPDPKDFANA
jgi:cytochrome b pre-mRNA-processing protein 3